MRDQNWPRSLLPIVVCSLVVLTCRLPAQNHALKLEGGTITFPHHPAMNTGETVTFEGWVRAESLPSTPLYVVARKKPSNEHKELLIQADGSIGFLYAGSPWPQRFTAPGTFAFDGQWHHVAGERRADQTYAIYYDGQPVLIGGPGPCWRTCSVINADPVSTIGGGQWSAVANSWDIDSVRVSTVARYDGAFSPRSHWRADSNTAFLVLFDEGQGATISGSSSSGQVGQLTGAASWVEGVGGNQTASYQLVGVTCPGTTTPTLTFAEPPILGSPFTVGAEDLPVLQLAVLMFGFADTVGGAQLPVSLAALGLPACHLYTSAEVGFSASTGGSGMVSVTLPIPSNLALLGATFRNQVFVRDSVSPPGLASSEGGEGVIGNR